MRRATASTCSRMPSSSRKLSNVLPRCGFLAGAALDVGMLAVSFSVLLPTGVCHEAAFHRKNSALPLDSP